MAVQVINTAGNVAWTTDTAEINAVSNDVTYQVNITALGTGTGGTGTYTVSVSQTVSSTSIYGAGGNYITRNGNATQGTFSPFSRAGWSTYLPATGGTYSFPYLGTTTSSVFAPGNSSGTIECWMYLTAYPSGSNPAQSATIWSLNAGDPSYNALKVNSDGTISAARDDFYAYTSTATTSSSLISLNTWYHIAWTYTGSANLFFLNGQDITSLFGSPFSVSGWPITGSPYLYIGATNYNSYIYGIIDPWIGYISNFRIVTGTTVYTSAFTPPTAPLTVTTNTKLLTCQSNRFVDNSIANSGSGFAVTPYFGPSVQPFSPFTPASLTSVGQSVWSNYIDSGGYAISSAAVIATTTTTFTIEGWIYPTAAAVSGSNVPAVIGDMQPAGATNYWSFGTIASGAVVFYWYDGVAKSAVTAGKVTLNQWSHIAISVNSNTISMYINGSLQTLTGTTTLTNRSGTTSTVVFGAYSNGGSLYVGYISNFSVLSGTAKYSGAAIAPPLAPLSTSTTNQTLLFAYGNSVADFNTATTTKTFTVSAAVGAISIQPFTSFTLFNNNTLTGPGLSGPLHTGSNLSSALCSFGGSGYFDYTGSSYLSITTPATYYYSALGDWTWEAWVYPLSFNGPQYSCAIMASSTDSVLLRVDPTSATSSTLNMYAVGLSGALPLGSSGTSAGSITINQWSHVALQRRSGRFDMFLNGTSIANVTSQTSTSLVTTDTSFLIGAGNAGVNPYWNGYISGVVVKNGTATYSGTTYTVPTAPPAPTGAIFCLNFTNGGIYDSTDKNNLISTGTVQVSNTQTRFGPTSIYFSGGSGNYLDDPNITTAQFGTGDFTIEGWIYINSLATAQVIFEFRSVNGVSYGQIYIDTSGLLHFYLPTDVSTSNSFSATTWTHFAITRASGTLNMYINGTRGYTGSYTSAMDAARLRIGAHVDGVDGLNAYLQEVRITKGYARYIDASLYIPTAPFLTQ